MKNAKQAADPGEVVPQLLRVAEFAQTLGISVWTAREWAYKGRITSVKIGQFLYVPASEFSRLVREGTRPAVAHVEGSR